MIITYGAGGGGDSEITIEGTLLASGWSSGLQQVTFEGLTVDSVGMITLSDSATAEQKQAAEDSGIIIANVNGDTVVFQYLFDAPSIDCPISIHLFPEESSYGGGGVYSAITINMPEKQPLENTSWEKISTVSDAGIGRDYWAIGDSKSIVLNGTVGRLALSTTLKVFIIGFDHNEEIEGKGITFQGFKTSSGVDAVLCDSYYGMSASYSGTKYFQMNHWGTSSKAVNYGGWKGSDIRYDILGSTNTKPSGYGSANTSSRTGYDAGSTTPTSPVENTLMAALPADLRAVLKPMTIYTNNKGGTGTESASWVTSSVDYLPLLAEYEIFGQRIKANVYESAKQKQYEYYANGNSIIKYKHDSTGTMAYWWQRSAPLSARDFCYVYNSSATYDASFSFGLAPAFRV